MIQRYHWISLHTNESEHWPGCKGSEALLCRTHATTRYATNKEGVNKPLLASISTKIIPTYYYIIAFRLMFHINTPIAHCRREKRYCRIHIFHKTAQCFGHHNKWTDNVAEQFPLISSHDGAALLHASEF